MENKVKQLPFFMNRKPRLRGRREKIFEKLLKVKSF